jgi:hypothetical protein
MKNKFNEEKQDQLAAELKAKFGADFWVKPGYEWRSGAILWSGEGAMMPDGMPAFSPMSYESDSEEAIYTLCVHNDLVKWADAKGLYWEAYDSGTYLAYPI